MVQEWTVYICSSLFLRLWDSFPVVAAALALLSERSPVVEDTPGSAWIGIGHLKVVLGANSGNKSQASLKCFKGIV